MAWPLVANSWYPPSGGGGAAAALVVVVVLAVAVVVAVVVVVVVIAQHRTSKSLNFTVDLDIFKYNGVLGRKVDI